MMLALALAATCATLPAVVRDAPAGETVVLTTDCTPNTTLRIRGRAVTVDASNRQVWNLWIDNSTGLYWKGGTIRAALNGAGRAGYAVTVERSTDVVVEGATITEAMRGLVTIRNTGHIVVRNNLFVRVRGDGINIAGDLALPAISALVESNRFREFLPRRDLGDHPDCIQMWGNLNGVVVRNNHIEDGTDCQGITTFGNTNDPLYQNITIEGNHVHVADAEGNAIAVGNAAGARVRGNIVRGRQAYVRLYEPFDGVSCGNSVERQRPSHIPPSRWGTEPCSIQVKVVVPKGVEVVVEHTP